MSQDLSPRKMSVTHQVILLGAVLNVSYLATCIHKSSRVYLFQQAQCLNYYQANDPTKIDSNYHVDESLCKIHEVQSPLSILDGMDSFLQNLPGKAAHSTLRYSNSTPSHAKVLPYSAKSSPKGPKGNSESTHANIYNLPY